jgi:fengycin family lipopeptide synthetase D
VQVVVPAEALSFEVDYRDLRGEQYPDQQAEAIALAQKGHVFDLAQAPLLQCTLLQITDEQFLCLFTIHHIIFDGWSENILVRDFTSLYKSFRDQTACILPELSIQYKDFSAWHTLTLAEKGEDLKNYWAKELAVVAQRGRLEREPPATPPQSREGVLITCLDQATTNRLRAYCRGHDVSEFVFLLTCIKVLLYRNTGNPHVVVGSPGAGRENDQLTNQIGFYLNLLPFCTRVDAATPFPALLADVRSRVLRGLDHQAYPYDAMVENLRQLAPGYKESTLFEVGFTWHSSVDEPGQNGGVFEIGPYKVSGHYSGGVDLWFHMHLNRQGLGITVEYDAAAFEAVYVDQLARALKILIEQVLDNGQRTVGEYRLAGAEQAPLAMSLPIDIDI